MNAKQLSFEPYNALKSILEVTSSRVGTDFLQEVCFALEKLFEADLVFISEIIDTPITQVIIRYSSSTAYSGTYKIENTPCDLVFKHGLTNINEGVNKKFSEEKGTDFESFYGIPLYNEKKGCIGHIAILSNYARILPNEAEDIALIFARRIEAEMTRIKLESENKRITQKLFKLSITDPLTEIYNRRYFVRKCTESFSQFKRGAIKGASIIFLDIDDFKVINDKYGHTSGDFVLKEISKILKDNSRENVDFIARVGGEEFGILSIDSEIKDAETYAKRVMKKTKEFFTMHQFSITFSIGIASFTSIDENWEETYNLADDRMYEAKRQGKNRIVSQ